MILDRMKNKLISIISGGFFFIAVLLLCACSGEDDYQDGYRYPVNQEIKGQIRKGIDFVSSNDKKEFNQLYTDVIEMCNSERMGVVENPYIYLEEPEYKELRNFFKTSTSPYVYYLLLDKYMLYEHEIVRWMFIDIVDQKYPGLLLDAEIEAGIYPSTHVNQTDTFPSVYAGRLIEVLESEIE